MAGIVLAKSSGGAGGVSDFVSLTDTPGSLTAGVMLRVNAGATALENVAVGTSGNVLYDNGSIWGTATPDTAGLVDKSSAQTGIAGNKTWTGVATFQPASDSTAALQLLDNAGSVVFNFNSTDEEIALGTATTQAQLTQYQNTALTTTDQDFAVWDHETSGTAGTGFGCGFLVKLKKGATASQVEACRFGVEWGYSVGANQYGSFFIEPYDRDTGLSHRALEAGFFTSSSAFVRINSLQNRMGIGATSGGDMLRVGGTVLIDSHCVVSGTNFSVGGNLAMQSSSNYLALNPTGLFTNGTRALDFLGGPVPGNGTFEADTSRFSREYSTAYNDVQNIAIFNRTSDTRASNAAGMGGGLLLKISSTGGTGSGSDTGQQACRLTWEAVSNTHATRAYRGKLLANYTTTERECFRWEADASNPLIGFYGTAAAAQDTGWTTFTNLSTDKTCDANATSVAELADILGTLIEQLKTLGLIAA